MTDRGSTRTASTAVLALVLVLVVACNSDAILSVTIVNPCDSEVVVERWEGSGLDPDLVANPVYPPRVITLDPGGSDVSAAIAGSAVVFRADQIGFREVVTSAHGVDKDVIVTLPEAVCER